MSTHARHPAVGQTFDAEDHETHRREAENARALLQLSEELAGSTEPDEVSRRVAARTAGLLDASYASVWLPEEASDGLRCAASWSREPDRSDTVLHEVLAPRIASALTGSRDPSIVQPGRYAIAPFGVQGRLGAIAVNAPRDPDERSLQLLGGIAGQAGSALSTAFSFRTLEWTFLATIEALANALEAKDASTRFYARWTTDMALRVGEELGLDQAALKRVELGTLLHDIGKIGIPASILSKPGPLTTAERRLIETHPEIAERILAPIQQLAEVRPVVRACHENWDGSGYPDGLRGEEIPLEARIIFACDAFHAMISERPYRPRLSVDEARGRLRAGAGTQFDPRVADVCLRVFDELDGP
jgi:HD-GYP domain-containing protein (c-di-GMP phosphodiesterase class II)